MLLAKLYELRFKKITKILTKINLYKFNNKIF